MGTLINHNYQWTSKSYKDMFVQNLAIVATMLMSNAYAFTNFIA
jgi:hypothetical protein